MNNGIDNFTFKTSLLSAHNMDIIKTQFNTYIQYPDFAKLPEPVKKKLNNYK